MTTYFIIAYIMGVIASCIMVWMIATKLIPSAVKSFHEPYESNLVRYTTVLIIVMFIFFALFMGIASVWKLVVLL